MDMITDLIFYMMESMEATAPVLGTSYEMKAGKKETKCSGGSAIEKRAHPIEDEPKSINTIYLSIHMRT